MKRSQVNKVIGEALVFCQERNFLLPPFAHWTLSDWLANHEAYQEIVDNQMGWDITDFASGDFAKVGALIFVLRNGNSNNPAYPKPYCEKILIQAEGQLLPTHFHWKKMEDIVNRGGGTLLVALHNALSDEALDPATPVTVTMDGRSVKVPAGEPLEVGPGESVTLTPRQFHSFWVKPGSGKVLLGEVSTVADEEADNNFPDHHGRLPDIEEDEAPRHLLFKDYVLLKNPDAWPDAWKDAG